MRIAYVSRRTWPARGGTEAILQRLYRHVAERHDVSVIAQRIDSGNNRPIVDAVHKRPFAPFADGPVPVRPFALSPARRVATTPLLLQASGRLRRASKHGRVQELTGAAFARIAAAPLARALDGAELVHVLGGYDMACAGVEAAARLGIPAVVSPYAHPGAWDDDAASAWAYRRADCIVATLDADADIYRSLGVPEERIEIIGHFTEDPPGGLDPLRLRAAHGIDGPLVVFLGGRYPHKGVEILLAAAERVDATFAFVGPGPRVSGPRVIDAGAVDDHERWEWLAAADILSLPSAAEAFGLVLLEAWAMRTAVVTTDIRTLVELVGRAGGGETVARPVEAQTAAIKGLLAAPERMRALADSGHRYWLEHGRAASVVTRYEALYERLLAGRSNRSVVDSRESSSTT